MTKRNTDQSDLHQPYRFDPIDIDQVRLLAGLPPGHRIRVMLDARDLAVGLIRGRLRKRYPDLSNQDVSMKLIEEVNRVQRRLPRF